MTENGIQIAVARADLILCLMTRVLAVALMAVLLIALVWCVREALARQPNVVPYDITSEGPDTYTANWFIWECEEKGEIGPTEHGPKGRQYDHK